MSENNEWKYCVVGNIAESHMDRKGILRYGTSAFTGGTKVYLCGKHWEEMRDDIGALGLTRGNRFQVISTDVRLIENLRLQKVYKPTVLHIMNDFEFWDIWWGSTPEDRASAEAFIKMWNDHMQKTP